MIVFAGLLLLREPAGSTVPIVGPAPAAVASAAPAPVIEVSQSGDSEAEDEADRADQAEFRRHAAKEKNLFAPTRPSRRKRSARPAAAPAASHAAATRDRGRVLSAADLRRADRGAAAISVFCLRLAQERPLTDAEGDAFARGLGELPALLRKDPDTYYLWPSLSGALTIRRTMRQVVGQARDSMASYGCFPVGAREFNTALETLPR